MLFNFPITQLPNSPILQITRWPDHQITRSYVCLATQSRIPKITIGIRAMAT